MLVLPECLYTDHLVVKQNNSDPAVSLKNRTNIKLHNR